MLLEDAASTLRDLPRDAAPQLRALVAHADPFATFHAIAARAGLPLPRVYRLARHLCEWKRARVIAVVRPDAVYAVDEVPLSIPVDARDAVRASDAMILAAFGPCKRLGDALDVLETTRGRDAATERVLALLRRGALRELHTYVLRVDAAPPPGLGAVATAARGKPARGERSDHLRLLHVFRALSPCFDGQHSLLEMMWRQDLSQAEVDAALRAFSDLVVTVQRGGNARPCVPYYGAPLDQNSQIRGARNASCRPAPSPLEDHIPDAARCGVDRPFRGRARPPVERPFGSWTGAARLAKCPRRSRKRRRAQSTRNTMAASNGVWPKDVLVSTTAPLSISKRAMATGAATCDPVPPGRRDTTATSRHPSNSHQRRAGSANLLFLH